MRMCRAEINILVHFPSLSSKSESVSKPSAMSPCTYELWNEFSSAYIRDLEFLTLIDDVGRVNGNR